MARNNGIYMAWHGIIESIVANFHSTRNLDLVSVQSCLNIIRHGYLGGDGGPQNSGIFTFCTSIFFSLLLVF